MSNAFDQFDAPAANPFDQFDHQPPPVNDAPVKEFAQTPEAKTWLQGVQAGAESSVPGLSIRGKLPDMSIGRSSPTGARIAANVTQMGLELPWMIAGGIAGTEGGPAGAGAGALALPTFLREHLMDQYANGSVKSWGEFWNRSGHVFLQTGKSGALGAATAGAGEAVKPLAASIPIADTVAPVVASGVRTTAQLGAQAATLATVGPILDQRVPTWQDIQDAAILTVGFHAATAGVAKISNIYAKTGIEPADVVQDAKNNPGIAQDLASVNIEMPKAYEPAVEAPIEGEKPAAPGERTIEVPGFGSVTLNENQDIPWAGGSSEDGKTVYVQKGIDLNKTIDGKSYDFGIPLGIHELTERQLEDEGQSYSAAHKAAEAAEDAWVQQNWPEIADKYESMWKPDIQFAEDRAKAGNVNVPPDLVVKPYEHPDNPLEERMHQEIFGGGERPPKASNQPLSEGDARKAILDRLSIGEKNQVNETIGQRFDRYYTNIVDRIYPIKNLVDTISGDQDISVSKDAGKLAQLLNGLSAKADGFIKFGTRDFDTYKVNGKGLGEILDPVKDDMDGFRSYWVAKRALELSDRDIKTGVPLDAAQTLADSPELKAKYEPVLAEIRSYRENLLNYGRDIIGQKNIDKMLSDNPDYAPFQRVIERMSNGSSGQQPFNPIKAIKGSERTIIDPMESLIKQTYQIVSLTEKNAVNKALVGMLDDFPDEAKDYIQKVPRKMWPIDVQAQEMAKAMDEQGIKGDPEAFTIFRPQALNPADNQIAVFEDGKRSIYQVPDDVAVALKGLDQETVAPWLKMLGMTSKTLRVGVTLTPEFQARHLLRMSVYSFLYSDKLELPFTGLVRGALGVLTKDEDYQSMLQAGAAHANIQSFDREFLQGSIDDAVETSNLVNKSSWNVVGQGISKLQAISQFMDTSWRLGEYKSVLGESDTKEAMQDAAYKARTVIVDLAQSGARMRAINSITAFQQTIINDATRMVQALKNEPTKVLPRIAAGVVLPSVLLWAANRNNAAVQNSPDWEKDSYWLIPTGDKPGDAILRWPKPFGVGVLFGSGVERALDLAASSNPKAFDHFAENFLKSFVPTDLPNFITPPIEQFANKSLFTGGPIIPHDREGLLPAYQYTPYTSETAKVLGRMIGMLPGGLKDKPGSMASPAIVEHYITSWTGTMGMYALQASDYALKKAGLVPDVPKPRDTLSDIPFVRAFVVRYPSSGAQPVQDFYDHMDEMKTVQDTVAKLTKDGNYQEALDVQREKLYDMVKMQVVEQAIGNSAKIVRQTYVDPNMTPDDKRQIIDAAYYQMIEMAKAGNEAYEENRKQIKAMQ